MYTAGWLNIDIKSKTYLWISLSSMHKSHREGVPGGPVVRPGTFIAVGLGSIPGQATKQVMRCGQKKVTKDNTAFLLSSIPALMVFMHLSLLITLARTSNLSLNRSDDSMHFLNLSQFHG